MSLVVFFFAQRAQIYAYCTVSFPFQKKASSLPPPKNDDNALAAYKDRYPNIASIASNELPLKSEHKR